MRKAKWNNCTKVLNDWIARDVIHYFFARGRWMKGMNAEMESRPADIHETRGKMVWLNERFCFMTSIITHVGTPSRGVLVPEIFFLGGRWKRTVLQLRRGSPTPTTDQPRVCKDAFQQNRRRWYLYPMVTFVAVLVFLNILQYTNV